MTTDLDSPTAPTTRVPRVVDSPAGTNGQSEPWLGLANSGGPPAEPRKLPSPLRPSDFGTKDIGLLAMAALSSFCLVWVVFNQLTVLSGAFGFLVCWYIGFLVLTWIGAAQLIERRVATDRVVAIVMVSAALLIVFLVFFIVIWVAYKAVPTMHWGALFTKDQHKFVVAAPNALATVGILHAIIGTLEQVLIAAALGVPAAVATAIFLNEVRGRGVRIVRTVVTAMSGTPSVVAGIFIYSILILTHVLTYSGFAASLALTVILLPSVTRVVEEVLRVVPSGLREASAALGAPEWRTTWSVVLPTARSGVVTAVLLGVARIVGETAPLLFTAFGSQVTNTDPFAHPQAALPLIIWSDVGTAQPVLIDLAFQAAFVLICIVLILFVLARVFSRTKGKKRNKVVTPDDPMARMFVPLPMASESEADQ